MSKNMLKDFDYDAYYKLLADATRDEIHLLHCFDPDFAWGGCTIAWRRTGPFKNAKMLQVAVSYCSPNDQFCRQIGAFNVLANFQLDETILVPLGCDDSATIVENLRTMFYNFGCDRPDMCW